MNSCNLTRSVGLDWDTDTASACGGNKGGIVARLRRLRSSWFHFPHLFPSIHLSLITATGHALLSQLNILFVKHNRQQDRDRACSAVTELIASFYCDYRCLNMH